MADKKLNNARIPLVEERLVVDKRTVETGRLRVRTVVDHQHAMYKEQLNYQRAVVNRVEINRDIDTPPAIRQEGDLLIVPVVDEYLFVEKRLRLREELHVRLESGVDHVAETVPVRRMRAVVERLGPGGDATEDPSKP
jgi:stress response protein YsnF